MLASSEEEAAALVSHAKEHTKLVRSVFDEYDVSASGVLETDEALRFFTALALELLRAAADGGHGAAAAHARRLLGSEGASDPDCSEAVAEMAAHLLHIADHDAKGTISMDDLADLFMGEWAMGGTRLLARRPRELQLYELRGSLQLLPRIARHFEGALEHEWHDKVPGDSHTLMRWVAPTHAQDSLSIVGLGRSADASCYYLPEWSLVLDAGIATKSFIPKTILLSHGHRDHVQALPALARPRAFDADRGRPPKVLLPAALEPLARRFLLAESVLNYGREQTEADNYAALGEPDLHPCVGGEVVPLPRECFDGREGLCVEVFEAAHKDMPALAYGLFRRKKKLKPEFAAERHRIKLLLREAPGTEVTELVRERIIFYSGDTSIELLQRQAESILRYQYVIHECSFIGPPSWELDEYAGARGHTHYAQLHPYICSAPETVFILVHWSIRYSREDVEAFFDEQYGGVPRNVVLWI